MVIEMKMVCEIIESILIDKNHTDRRLRKCNDVIRNAAQNSVENFRSQLIELSL